MQINIKSGDIRERDIYLTKLCNKQLFFVACTLNFEEIFSNR